MIKSGGENIHPSEIETILAQHPAITEVAVIGMPDLRLGETVCANIVLKSRYGWNPNQKAKLFSVFVGEQRESPDASVSVEDFHAFCVDSGLSRFKLPKLFVVQSDPLPRSPTGKVDKAQIRAKVRHIICLNVENGRRILSKL